MERKGSFYFSNGREMSAIQLSEEFKFDWEDVINIALQLTDPDVDPESFTDYCEVINKIKNSATKEDLIKLDLEFISKITSERYNTTPLYTRMNDDIDRQIDREMEAEYYNAPRRPDGSRYPGDPGYPYSREDRRRQIINGQENQMWEERRRRRGW